MLFGKKRREENVFPFADSPNTAAFVCCHVLDGERPVLRVTHDEDGYWQFLCGGGHTEAEARVVSLEEAYSIDKSTGALAGMDYGCTAERDTPGGEWRIARDGE